MVNPVPASLATFVTLLLSCLGLFLWMCAPYLLPVFMGEVLALLMLPLYRALSRRLPRPLASLASTLAVLCLVIAPIALIVTMGIKEGTALARDISDKNEKIEEKANQIVGRARRFIGDPQAAKEQLRQGLQSGGKAASLAVLEIAGAIPQIALQLTLSLLACYFFLLQDAQLPRRLVSRLPIDPDLRSDLVDAIEGTAISTLWAGMAAAVSQASIVLVGFLLLGMPAAFLAAGATFIFAWIPMLGVIPVALAGGLYLILKHEMAKLAGLAVIVSIAGVADNLVRPLVLKGGDRLHPLLSLIAIFGGIQLFGLLGVFIGPVLAAVLIALYDFWPRIAARHSIPVDGDVRLSPD